MSPLPTDGCSLAVELCAFNRRDATVVIGFAPYSHRSMQVAHSARKSGSYVLAMCYCVVAPNVLQADVVLVFATNTPSFFPSSTSALALVEILIAQLLAQAGPSAVEGLKRAEEQLHATGAYLNAR